jgi:hypothetical protein
VPAYLNSVVYVVLVGCVNATSRVIHQVLVALATAVVLGLDLLLPLVATPITRVGWDAE